MFIMYFILPLVNKILTFKAAKEKYKFTIGIFYRTTSPVYHKELYGNHNTITKKLLKDTGFKKTRKLLDLNNGQSFH